VRPRPLPQEPPLVELALRPVEEPPFLRPKTRTRVRPVRRGLIARLAFVLQLVAGVAVAVTVAWTGYEKVMASERLKVGRIEVRGSHFLSEAEVRERLSPAVGENILTVDIEALTTLLRASPWVADATVKRTLPDVLQVDIRERVPLALAELERLHLMDEDGTLIDVYGPRTAGFDLPIVRGLLGLEGGERRDRARRAGALLGDLAELGSEISEVHVEDSGDLRVVLRGAGEVLRLGGPPYRKRFTTFLALRRDLRDRCPDAEYCDLRFRDRIYAKQPPAPAPRANVTPEPTTPVQTAAVIPPVATAPAAATGPSEQSQPTPRE